jgi:hypothetical protein
MSQDKTTCSVEITKGQIGQAYIEVHMSAVSAALCPPLLYGIAVYTGHCLIVYFKDISWDV